MNVQDGSPQVCWRAVLDEIFIKNISQTNKSTIRLCNFQSQFYVLNYIYSTHQLKLKHDTCTHRGHTRYTHMILWYTRNYTYYELPSCIGLHVYPPTIYTKSSILHANTCSGCDKCDATCTSILLPRSHQSHAKLCTCTVAYWCSEWKHQS